MSDAWRAYLDLALGLTEAPRKKAQQVAGELLNRGGATAAQVQGLVEDLLTAGLANREALTSIVRYEVDRALGRVGLATADEVSDLTNRVHELERQLRKAEARTANPVVIAEPSPVAAAPVKKAPVKQAPVKQAPVKQAPVKQAPVKQAPVKQAPVKSGAAKSTPAAPVEQAAPVEPAAAPDKGAGSGKTAGQQNAVVRQKSAGRKAAAPRKAAGTRAPAKKTPQVPAQSKPASETVGRTENSEA